MSMSESPPSHPYHCQNPLPVTCVTVRIPSLSPMSLSESPPSHHVTVRIPSLSPTSRSESPPSHPCHCQNPLPLTHVTVRIPSLSPMSLSESPPSHRCHCQNPLPLINVTVRIPSLSPTSLPDHHFFPYHKRHIISFIISESDQKTSLQNHHVKIHWVICESLVRIPRRAPHNKSM